MVMVMHIDDEDISRPPTSFVAVNSERAPFIYCDGVMALGSTFGEVQLELGANTVVSMAEGRTRMEVVITAHLRCSPTAARILRDSIDKALVLAERAGNGAWLDAASPAGAATGRLSS